MPDVSRASCRKRTGDPGNRELAERFGTRDPVIQYKECPADEDKRQDQARAWIRPGRLKKRGERAVSKIEGQDRQRADRRHTEAETQKVCALLLGLRERDREGAGDRAARNPKALGPGTGKGREAWAVTTWARVMPVARLRTFAAKGGDRGALGWALENDAFR